MPLPLTVSCFSKIQIGFTFLVPAHRGSSGKRPLNGCVCVNWFCEHNYCLSMMTTLSTMLWYLMAQDILALQQREMLLFFLTLWLHSLWCMCTHTNACCRWPQCSSSLWPDFWLSWWFIDVSKSDPFSSVLFASVPYTTCEISHNRSVHSIWHCCCNSSSGVLQILFFYVVVKRCWKKINMYFKVA